MKVRYIGKTDPSDLIHGGIYEVVSVEKGVWGDCYRIVLETDENNGNALPGYLYPENNFEVVEGEKRGKKKSRKPNDIFPKGKICPVCGKHKFEFEDFFEICPVCGWKDDRWQRENPDFQGGANKMSLNQFRKAWLAGKIHQ